MNTNPKQSRHALHAVAAATLALAASGSWALGLGRMAVQSALGVVTVRDLSVFPPFRAAREILNRAFFPDQLEEFDPERPADLLPKSGEFPTERVQYLGGTRRRYASVGDVIKVSIKDAIPRGRVKKGEVYNAVVVRTAKGVRRNDGSLVKFDGNAAVLLNAKLEPIGTRIFGPVTRELRTERFMKSVSLAPDVL